MLAVRTIKLDGHILPADIEVGTLRKAYPNLMVIRFILPNLEVSDMPGTMGWSSIPLCPVKENPIERAGGSVGGSGDSVGLNSSGDREADDSEAAAGLGDASHQTEDLLGDLHIVCRRPPFWSQHGLLHPKVAAYGIGKLYRLTSLTLIAENPRLQQYDPQMDSEDEEEEEEEVIPEIWQGLWQLVDRTDPVILSAIFADLKELISHQQLYPGEVRQVLEAAPNVNALSFRSDIKRVYEESGLPAQGLVQNDLLIDGDEFVHRALRSCNTSLDHRCIAVRDGLHAVSLELPFLRKLARKSLAMPILFGQALEEASPSMYLDAGARYQSGVEEEGTQPYLLTLLVTEEDCLKVNPMDAAYYLVRKYPATTEISFDTLLPRQSREVSRWIRNVLGSRAMLIRTLLGGAVPGFRKVAGVREISAEM